MAKKISLCFILFLFFLLGCESEPEKIVAPRDTGKFLPFVLDIYSIDVPEKIALGTEKHVKILAELFEMMNYANEYQRLFVGPDSAQWKSTGSTRVKKWIERYPTSGNQITYRLMLTPEEEYYHYQMRITYAEGWNIDFRDWIYIEAYTARNDNEFAMWVNDWYRAGPEWQWYWYRDLQSGSLNFTIFNPERYLSDLSLTIPAGRILYELKADSSSVMSYSIVDDWRYRTKYKFYLDAQGAGSWQEYDNGNLLEQGSWN